MASIKAVAVRPVGYNSFHDLIPVAPRAITRNDDGTLTVEFPDPPEGDPPWSAATLAAVKARVESRTEAEAELRKLLASSLAVNDAFRAAPTPIGNHLELLTDQVSAIIRVLLRLLPDDDEN